MYRSIYRQIQHIARKAPVLRIGKSPTPLKSRYFDNHGIRRSAYYISQILGAEYRIDNDNDQRNNRPGDFETGITLNMLCIARITFFAFENNQAVRHGHNDQA